MWQAWRLSLFASRVGAPRTSWRSSICDRHFLGPRAPRSSACCQRGWAVCSKTMAHSIRVSVEGIENPDARRAATERAREPAILELYRIGEISSGRAAGDLRMSRVGFLELAHRHQIPTIRPPQRSWKRNWDRSSRKRCLQCFIVLWLAPNRSSRHWRGRPVRMSRNVPPRPSATSGWTRAPRSPHRRTRGTPTRRQPGQPGRGKWQLRPDVR
jgi:hypothetical protein